MHLNLLPPDYVEGQAISRRLTGWLAAIIASALASSVFVGVHYLQVASLREQLNAASVKHPDVMRIVADMSQWERQMAEANVEIAALDKLHSDKRALTLIGHVVKSLESAQGQIRLQRLNLQIPSVYSETTPKVVPAKANAASTAPVEIGKGALALEGIAEESGAMSQFITGLNKNGVLMEVNLKGSSQRGNGPDQGRQFRIECSF